MPGFCPQCGSRVADDDRFCGQCGARLAAEAREKPAPAKPPPPPPAVAAGRLLWQVSLPGEWAEIIPDRRGRFAHRGSREGGSLLVRAIGLPDESLEADSSLGGILEEDLVELGGPESGHVCALSPADGQTLWSVGFGKEAFGVDPLSPERLAVALLDRGSLLALDLASGRPSWLYRLAHKTGNLPRAVAGGLLAVGDGPAVVGLEGNSGQTVWQTKLDSPPETLAADEKIVLAATGKGGLVALQPEQGTVLWQKQLPGAQLKLLAQGVALVAVAGQKKSRGASTLVALDPASGQERWSAGDIPQIEGLGHAAGRLFVHTWDSRLRALDLANGAEIWALDNLEPDMSAFWAQDGLLLVSDGERLSALQPENGSLIWQARAGEYEIPALALDAAAGAIYLGTDQGRVASLDPATGKTLWEVALPARTVENIFIDLHGKREKKLQTQNADVNQLIPDGTGRLYVTADGNLYAVG
ncbi:MAG: PQQ-binding-like beta-propeller repeat protein [Deltaproteobacteria bacterium]|nr:PQQ-binding-like beta-propeller repeat protein [Deltaproteobacteria bacterium]